MREKLAQAKKHWLKRALRSFGYEVLRAPRVATQEDNFADLSLADKNIMIRAKPFTMTSEERLAALISAVRYVCHSRLPGDLVECGVWRGGSMMAAALTLLDEGDTVRHLYLYDTFSGMSEPTNEDKNLDGKMAQQQLDSEPVNTGIWCHASLKEVQENLYSTGYPKENIHFVQGKVEETIPKTMPEGVAVLRLDTDWYESTRHELLHLFPRLAQYGILILDDYGHWQGARKAADEYFAQRQKPIFLHRVDYTARIAVKTGD